MLSTTEYGSTCGSLRSTVAPYGEIAVTGYMAIKKTPPCAGHPLQMHWNVVPLCVLPYYGVQF
jgi:hypothetical protein